MAPTAPSLPSTDVDVLRARIAQVLPGVRADLEALVRIPSVSAPAFDAAELGRSAAFVADLLRGAGLPEVEILRVEGGAPAVVGHRPPPEGAPTVLLYAHHDVQPPGDPSLWDTPAFEPVERDGRLFGRGAADDKAGVLLHLAALRALGDDLAVGVTVFVEGEEEVGSRNLMTFFDKYRDKLKSDVIVVADSTNWRVGEPALTTSLRGLVDGVITVRTLDHAVHSGMYGGAVPDAMTATLKLLAGLWDDDGQVAVPGLSDTDALREADDLGYAEELLRADAGVLDGVRLVGTGLIESRLWTRPALAVVGIDAPSIATASNTLLPAVSVKFSLRVPPGQQPAAAFEALRSHLVATAPWGAQVQVELGEAGLPWQGDESGPVYDLARWALEQAWGRRPVHMGVGGSIPFVALLGEVYPDATVLLTGVEDPDTRAHGTNESLHLGEFERACLAETLLLAALAR